MPAKKKFDAIVIGGGHNGLVNGAYLAKAGLSTLILERRHLVGGAAITEELHPGFSFTTFSYALSLLRPEIIHELELTKHGFMPLLMPSTFAPTEDGDYILLGQDKNENHHEISRHSPHDADAYDAYGHMMEQVVHAIRPLMDSIPPDITSKDPEERARMAAIGSYLADLPPGVLHDMIRLMTGSAADILEDYFESDIMQGLHASSGIIGTKVGPRSQGSGLVLLYHSFGEHDGAYGAWAFHKGGNGGFTQVLARSAESFGAEIRLESPVDHVITKNGRATGVMLEDGTELEAKTVVSAVDPRRTFMQLVDPRELPDRSGGEHPPLQVPGDVGQGQLRPRRQPHLPGAGGPARTSTGDSSTWAPRSTISSGPSTTPSTGGTRRSHISTGASSPTSIRTWPLRARR